MIDPVCREKDESAPGVGTMFRSIGLVMEPRLPATRIIVNLWPEFILPAVTCPCGRSHQVLVKKKISQHSDKHVLGWWCSFGSSLGAGTRVEA